MRNYCYKCKRIVKDGKLVNTSPDDFEEINMVCDECGTVLTSLHFFDELRLLAKEYVASNKDIENLSVLGSFISFVSTKEKV